jgi:hypothetical protein
MFEQLFACFGCFGGRKVKKKGGKNTALVIILTISYEKPRTKIYRRF